MLVLSRMKGQQIVIGGSITVTILEVRGDKVKLGFAGPAEIPIHRQEVHERLMQEQVAQRLPEPGRWLAESLAG